MCGNLARSLRAQIVADVDHGRERALELHVVGDAGVDQDAVVEIAGQEQRIALRGPGLLDDVDVDVRIEPRAHRPQHLVELAGVDVLVHHHRPLAGIGAALAGGGDVQRLPRVAGIALLDLDDGEARRRTGFVVPHAEHLRHAAGVERAPDLRGAGDALEQAGLVDRLVLRRAAQDRIVAIEDRFDVHIGARLGVVGVVAHPLAERPFRPHLPGHGLAFEHDLGVGRDREAGVGAADHVDRLAAQAAGDVELADLGQRRRSEHEQQRVLAAHDRDLHRLAALEILVAVDAAVLALGDLAADGVAVIDLRAVGAEIEPAGVGILGHDAAGGADIARLVLLVVQRHRELQHVDGVAFEHVLQHRPVLHDARRRSSSCSACAGDSAARYRPCGPAGAAGRA